MEQINCSPFKFKGKIIEHIDNEIACAEAGQEAYIIAKMNSLLDKGVIAKLYEASSKGVKIDLIVRGICTLRPGMEGVSENIQVRSIVGRFWNIIACSILEMPAVMTCLFLVQTGCHVI